MGSGCGLGQHGVERAFLCLLISIGISIVAPAAGSITTEALLDSLQSTAFDFFWNEANPSNGLIKDRNTSGSPCSIASVGFGLTAICIGIDHGWVSRAVGRDRVLTTLQTLWATPQGSGPTGFCGYQGLYYHFLDMNTATRVWDSELSTIDTALLFAGVLDAKEYFKGDDPSDVEVRSLADSITQRANWEFARNSGVGIRMGWKPGTGFDGFGTWVGYNEAMIMYIIALGSPTYPIPASTWFTWTSGYDWTTEYGYTYVNFPPLFGHQYSHCWIDFRGIQDIFTRSKGIDYFENSRRATLAARAYCIANPGGFVGYGENLWGLTASDGPYGYTAHGAPPPQNDDGTITPTAAASSIAFAPDVAIPALHHMFDMYGAELWSTYGFKDAFNPTLNWYGPDYLGIDQGPIIIMIENYRSGAVWTRFMRNQDIQLGLARAGFTSATGVQNESTPEFRSVLEQNAPNPFTTWAKVSYRLEATGPVSVVLYDVMGRKVRTLLNGVQSEGDHELELRGDGLPSGIYYYRLTVNGRHFERKCVVVR